MDMNTQQLLTPDALDVNSPETEEQGVAMERQRRLEALHRSKPRPAPTPS